jgi:hypothetical protein
MQAKVLSRLSVLPVTKLTTKPVQENKENTKVKKEIEILKLKVENLKLEIKRIQRSVKIPFSFSVESELLKRKDQLFKVEKQLKNSRNYLKLKLLEIFNFKILSNKRKLYINNLEFSFHQEIPREILNWNLQLIFHFLIIYSWYFQEFYQFSLNFNEIIRIIEKSESKSRAFLELLAKTRYNLKALLNSKENLIENLVISLVTIENVSDVKEQIEYNEIFKEICTEFSKEEYQLQELQDLNDWEFL